LRGGPDAALAAAIAQARLGVDIAMDTLDLWSLRDALIDAKRRGVTVRVVVESDNLDEAEIQDLVRAGIPVLGDRREGLMHNKFVVTDRMEVWTGSMNFTLSGAYRADNNLIRLRSAQLAENYLVEFEEMFVEDRFGPGSPANTPYSRLEVGGTPVEVYFSPDDGVSERLVEAVQGAQESIHFMAYSFTSDEIAEAILARAATGVEVAGVFDESQAGQNQGSEFQRLRDAGLEVRLDGNPHSMHHKVIVLDGQSVVTGSYNFSNNAETRNDENLLVIESPEIASQYEAEFRRVFEMAQPKGQSGPQLRFDLATFLSERYN
jgi:phosphatidylserine/phosphatidylglycerophosphate/cardiolipin synthase-like enzyme